MKFKQKKTPDQIRCDTVPVKHKGLIYGFLGGLLGATLWFGGWGLLHQKQVRRYPEYCASALQSSFGSLSPFGKQKKTEGMSAAELRYTLLRFGNQDHGLDSEIIRHGWFPREASPAPWVYENAALKPVYSDSPALVFKWPFTLSLLTFLTALIWGLVADYQYRAAVIAGIPFDGSIVATVDEYNKETKGNGMRYAVTPWKDR